MKIIQPDHASEYLNLKHLSDIELMTKYITPYECDHQYTLKEAAELKTAIDLDESQKNK